MMMVQTRCTVRVDYLPMGNGQRQLSLRQEHCRQGSVYAIAERRDVETALQSTLAVSWQSKNIVTLAHQSK